MKFYVDECLPPRISRAITERRGHRAHAVTDLGFKGREDKFHVARSRKRGEIRLTSNHHDFKRGTEWLKDHPGIVVLDPGAWTNTDDLVAGLDIMLGVLRLVRVGAKLPFRNTPTSADSSSRRDLWDVATAPLTIP
jgi:predicted nuclease of predicted toxin-antitoxin system